MTAVPDPTPYGAYARQVTAKALSADVLAQFPACRAWLAGHAADLRDWEVALPSLACLSAGGSLEDALEVGAAWLPFCLASDILDHVEDREFIPDEWAHSAEEATNLGTALMFLGFHHLASIQSAGGAARAGALFAGLGLGAAGGQHRSLAVNPWAGAPPTLDAALEEYWQAIIAKAGNIFRAGAAGGAAAATADEALIKGLGDYGTALGVMVQLLDDGRDILKTSESDDAIEAWEVSLPLLLYLLATGEQNVVFPAIRTRAEWRARLREARIIETFSGIFLQWKARALESIQGLSLSPEEKKMLEEFPVLILGGLKMQTPA